MATQQVKFYSVSTKPDNAQENGIYFVGGERGDGWSNGQIYKGSVRYGCPTITSVEDTSTLHGSAVGDINIYGGVAKIFKQQDGVNGVGAGEWVTLANSGALNVSLIGDSNAYPNNIDSILTGIKQENGLITAYARTFPTLLPGTNGGELQLNGTDAKVTGWASLTKRVSDIETVVKVQYEGTAGSSGSSIANTQVIAHTATFGSLEAVDITTSNNLNAPAPSYIVFNYWQPTASDTPKTLVGYVTETANDITQQILNASKTETITTSASKQIPTEGAVKKYVDAQLGVVGNVMHFVGTTTGDGAPTGNAVGSSLTDDETNSIGDIVLNTTTSKEYIYDGSTWVEIGDETHYANKTDITGGSDTDGSEGVSVTVSNANLTAEPTVTVSISAETLASTLDITPVVGKSVVTSIGAEGADTNLPTEKAVRTAISTLESSITGGTSSSSAKGVEVQVVTAATTAAPTVTTTVTLQSSITTACTNDQIPSAKAVSDALCWLDADGEIINTQDQD